MTLWRNTPINGFRTENRKYNLIEFWRTLNFNSKNVKWWVCFLFWTFFGPACSAIVTGLNCIPRAHQPWKPMLRKYSSAVESQNTCPRRRNTPAPWLAFWYVRIAWHNNTHKYTSTVDWFMRSHFWAASYLNLRITSKESMLYEKKAWSWYRFRDSRHLFVQITWLKSSLFF